jgi:hypothetical protein
VSVDAPLSPIAKKHKRRSVTPSRRDRRRATTLDWMGAWDNTCGGRTVHLDRSEIGVAPLGSNSEEASHEDQKEEVGAGSLVLCVCWFGCPAAIDSKTWVKFRPYKFVQPTSNYQPIMIRHIGLSNQSQLVKFS